MLHLDTSTVVAYLRGDTTVASQLTKHSKDLAISSLVLAELLYGAAISAQAKRNVAHVRNFASLVTVIDFDERAAQAYADMRKSLRAKGLQTGEMDALIASVALANDAELITHNRKHFENIEGLTITDWVS
jgi:tRNA(fMet)-specific endonuclease VapC